MVGGGRQGIGGVDADGGVGVCEQECGGVGGDRGSGGGHRRAGRVAGHLVSVVVVGVGGVAPGIVAVEEECLAGGDALVPGTGGGGEYGEGGGAVRVVGVDGQGDEERHGEGGIGPAVIGAQAPQHTRRVHARFAVSAQEADDLSDVVPMGEVAPRDGIEVRARSGCSQDAGHHRPHVERAAREQRQVYPAHHFPAHRERRIGPPVLHSTPPPVNHRNLIMTGPVAHRKPLALPVRILTLSACLPNRWASAVPTRGQSRFFHSAPGGDLGTRPYPHGP